MSYLLRLPRHLVDEACRKIEGCTYYCLVLLHTVSSVRSLVLCTWYGDRHEFRDGAPTADGVLLLDELTMMLYDAMDFASEAGSLAYNTTRFNSKKLYAHPGARILKYAPPHPQHPPLA